MHQEQSKAGQPWDAADEQGQLIERSRSLVLELCHEVDPAVQVTLHPYRWHGDAVLDIGLTLGGHEHHLQVTASRMKIVMQDPHMLEHDIEGAVEDLRRQGDAGVTSEEGAAVDHDAPAYQATSAAATAATETQGETAAPEAARAHPSAASGHHRVPETADEAITAGSAGEATPEEREVVDRTIDLARHIVGELDHAATVSFDEYRWHGDLVLDITVSLHGQDHHLQVSASRAAIILRDHDLLHHDLEEVVHALHRGED
jgi:hypothetical protein